MPGSQKSPGSKNANYSLAGTLAWFIIVGVSYILLLLILAGPHFFGHHLKAGDIAEQDILAPAKALVTDEEKTKEQEELIKRGVLPVLKRDARKSATIMDNLKQELSIFQKLQENAISPLPQPPVLTPEEQACLVQLGASDFQNFRKSLLEKVSTCPLGDPVAVSAYKEISKPQKPLSKSVPVQAKSQTTKAGKNSPQGKNSGTQASRTEAASVNSETYLAKLDTLRNTYTAFIMDPKNKHASDVLLLSLAVTPEESKQFLADLTSSVQRLLVNVSLQPYVDRREWEQEVYEFLPERIEASLRHAAAKFVALRLESNVVIDKDSTEARIKEALATMKPVKKEINLGSVIVQKGETISHDEVATLETMGITEVSDPGLATVIAIALFAAFLLYGVYLYTYEPKLFFSPSSIALMATVSILTVLIAFFIGPQYPQFVPLPATALILAVTYGRRLTGILVALIVLFLSVSELMAGPNLVALGAASGMALGASVKRRRDLMVTGLLVGLMQSIGYASAIVIAGTPKQMAGMPAMLPMEMLGGLISAIAAIGSLPFLENIFGILTPYRIAELAEPDQPLMRQLEENAPGTYQHSLAVANLAEGGARAIGADVNLVHTGAMYHDIGKMVTPRYFIENQLGDKNPHDFIPPEESREKVLAHVTNGIALAQKYGLPKAIQAFIPEHQGTTVIAYFYYKACQRDGSENVDPNLYRYPGPKPQTKESAIVMLADVSEAVTHSLHDPTMEEVESVISNVFKARWDDEQFSESGLSHDELEKVKRGFVRVWRTLHHDRLKYPSTTTGRMAVAPTSPSGSNTASSPAASQSGTSNGALDSQSDSAETTTTTASPSNGASEGSVKQPDQENRDANAEKNQDPEKPASAQTGPVYYDSCSHGEASEWDC